MQAWSKVSRMPAQGIRKMQDELLAKLVGEELPAKHPYYRELFKDKGIDPLSIRGVEDLKEVPFTTKADLLPREEDPDRSKRFVLEHPAPEDGQAKKKGFKLFGKKDAGADPLDYRLQSLYYTSGRTARPVPLVFTGYDIENLKEAGVRAFDVLGLTRDDTMVNAFSYFPNVSFWQIYYAGIELGSTVLQTGGGRVLGMEKILRALNNMEAPVMTASPGYAQFALQALAHYGFNMNSLERLIIGTDYAPMIQVERLRKLMAGVKAGNTVVQRIYSISEAKSGWAECEPGFGYHINPDHVLVEIVDPETGDLKGEGEAGEVVITNLDARGTVLLRYRTGDIATGGMTSEPCPQCGRTVPRILGDIERKVLKFMLEGEAGPQAFNAYSLVRQMLSKTDILQWYAEIHRSGKKDNLKVFVKAAKEIDDEKKLSGSLEKELGECLGIPVSVETSSLEAILERTGMERAVTEQRIFDMRIN